MGSHSQTMLVNSLTAGRPALPTMHSSVLTVLLMLVVAEVTLCTLDISILGNKFINTDFKYRTDPSAGLRNRGEFARQFGHRGELLVEELGKGHQGPDADPSPEVRHDGHRQQQQQQHYQPQTH